MSTLGRAVGFGAATAAGATAHVASAGRYARTHLEPVVEEDLRQIEQFGRLPEPVKG